MKAYVAHLLRAAADRKTGMPLRSPPLLAQQQEDFVV